MDTLLHCSPQDHIPAHSEGCRWCNGTDLDHSSHMEHHPPPEQLAWGMHKVPQKDTMPLTHLQVKIACDQGSNVIVQPENSASWLVQTGRVAKSSPGSTRQKYWLGL